MDPRTAAMAQQLQAGGGSPPPDMPPPGGAPGGQPAGPMPPEQAIQLLQSLGITPDKLPMVAAAVESVMQAQGGAGAPRPGAPPQGAPQGMPQ